jgi:hypothetical protein
MGSFGAWYRQPREGFRTHSKGFPSSRRAKREGVVDTLHAIADCELLAGVDGLLDNHPFNTSKWNNFEENSFFIIYATDSLFSS